jgi:hypothetical protein
MLSSLVRGERTVASDEVTLDLSSVGELSKLGLGGGVESGDVISVVAVVNRGAIVLRAVLVVNGKAARTIDFEQAYNMAHGSLPLSSQEFSALTWKNGAPSNPMASRVHVPIRGWQGRLRTRLDLMLGVDELGSILKHLDLKMRCTAICVSTAFCAAGTSQADVWRDCDFGSEPRSLLRDEDLSRVLRRAGNHLAVLKVSGPRITCGALQPLRTCSGLRHLSLTGCECVNAHALTRVLPPGESFQLDSLAVDGIYNLDDKSVGLLKSLVRGSELDVTECDVCEEFATCKVCLGRDCDVQICSADVDMECGVCMLPWCSDCESTEDKFYCDGPCGKVRCNGCAFSIQCCMFFCNDCDEVKCTDCAFVRGSCMFICDGCHTSRCNKCAFAGGNLMLFCQECHISKCEKCAFDDNPMHFCEGCGQCTCISCLGEKQCCDEMYAGGDYY